MIVELLARYDAVLRNAIMAVSATRELRIDTDGLAAALKVLADPNRLRILDALLVGTRCNCDLGDRLGMAPNLISHHLGILRRSGLVRAKRDPDDARWIHYSVNRAAVEELRTALSGFLDPDGLRREAGACAP